MRATNNDCTHPSCLSREDNRSNRFTDQEQPEQDRQYNGQSCIGGKSSSDPSREGAASYDNMGHEQAEGDGLQSGPRYAACRGGAFMKNSDGWYKQ